MRQTWDVDNIERAYTAVINSSRFQPLEVLHAIDASLQVITLSLLLVLPFSAHLIRHPLPPLPDVTNDQPTLNFPDSITFRATIESSAPITSVVA